ncbi:MULTISPECIES: hypothetical protein [Streptomyces]|uniref:Uncharacterized protein n=1 Tax=Streptomyces triticiradicis TaxID=2651189 RepID=A0A7J5D8M9_9ACTN|nr:hypothetical protein [Streptomyces triticiradicis]KAB1982872.1 hypothetical protein F8144_30235 [Streptomyces triticiradicis]
MEDRARARFSGDPSAAPLSFEMALREKKSFGDDYELETPALLGMQLLHDQVRFCTEAMKSADAH